MRSKRFLRVLAVAAGILLLLLLMTGLGLADAGNFGGDSDWGDGFDWGGGSDWGDSDWGSGSSGGGGFFFIPGGGGPFVAVIVVVIIIVAIRAAAKNQHGRGIGPTTVRPPGAPGSIDELKARDPAFSQEAFLEKVGNLYIQMQRAWQEKKWPPMRTHMTDAMFNQYQRQLDEYIQKNQTNHVERISILGTRILSCRKDEVNDIITVEVKTRIIDYVTDDQTGELVRGSKSRELFMAYEWTLIRSQKAKSVHSDGLSHDTCPNCGAPLSLNHSTQCEYCSTVVTASEYDWVISNIRGISQRSG